MPLSCDVVVFAHDEAESIEGVVRGVLTQSWGPTAQLARLIVCSAASTDGTDDIVQRIASGEPRVELIASSVRRGKARDVNDAVASTTAPMLVLMDADVAVNRDCLPLLVNGLSDPGCGMAIPYREVALSKGLLRRIGRLMAELQNVGPPKSGQVLAVRRTLAALPSGVTLDDAYQEYAVTAAGLDIRRVGGAVVTSTPPATVRDFLRQRRRVVAQCLALQRVTGYRPTTRSLTGLSLRLVQTPTARSVCAVYVLPAALLIDGVARTLGRWDYHVRKDNYATWRTSPSAKPYA